MPGNSFAYVGRVVFPRFTLPQAKLVFRGLLDGLQHIHERGLALPLSLRVRRQDSERFNVPCLASANPELTPARCTAT